MSQQTSVEVQFPVRAGIAESVESYQHQCVFSMTEWTACRLLDCLPWLSSKQVLKYFHWQICKKNKKCEHADNTIRKNDITSVGQ